MYVQSMYLFILFFFFLSPALQDFEECSVMQTCSNAWQLIPFFKLFMSFPND